MTPDEEPEPHVVLDRLCALLAATLLKIGDHDPIPRTDLRNARVPAISFVAAKPAPCTWWSTHPTIAERVDRLTCRTPPSAS